MGEASIVIEGLRCFGGASVPAELGGDFGPLNALLSTADLDEVIRLVLGHVLVVVVGPDGGGATALLPALEAFAATRSVNYTTKMMVILQRGVRGLVALLQAAARHAASPRDLSADAARLGFDAAHVATLERAWTAYCARAAYEAVLAKQSAVDGETLRRVVDMEWKFGVTAKSSTSDAASGKTFLQLNLVLDHRGTRSNLFLELSLPQFYDFFAQLDRAKAQLAIPQGTALVAPAGAASLS